MTETADALVYVAPGQAEIRPVPLPEWVPGMVEIRTRVTALSRGTERLVAGGKVPASEWDRMRAPFQVGAFPFPVAYGYAAVGEVEDGPQGLVGRQAFALAPHQSRLRLPAEAALPVPEGVPVGRAALAANMETALNAVWDARLTPGMRVAIVGAGLVGCLIAGLLSRRSDLVLTMCDVIEARAQIASRLDVTFTRPDALPSDQHVVFHTSATPSGLQASVDCLAFEGRVIELSWYGSTAVPVVLGGTFHARRLTIQSSQVGHVAAPRRATTTHKDRLAMALAALEDPRLDALISERIAFRDVPAALPRIFAAEETVATLIDGYDDDR